MDCIFYISHRQFYRCKHLYRRTVYSIFLTDISTDASICTEGLYILYFSQTFLQMQAFVLMDCIFFISHRHFYRCKHLYRRTVYSIFLTDISKDASICTKGLCILYFSQTFLQMQAFVQKDCIFYISHRHFYRCKHLYRRTVYVYILYFPQTFLQMQAFVLMDCIFYISHRHFYRCKHLYRRTVYSIFLTDISKDASICTKGLYILYFSQTFLQMQAFVQEDCIFYISHRQFYRYKHLYRRTV